MPITFTLHAREASSQEPAIDDSAAVQFDATALTAVLTTRAEARAYRVSPDGERPLDALLLT